MMPNSSPPLEPDDRGVIDLNEVFGHHEEGVVLEYEATEMLLNSDACGDPQQQAIGNDVLRRLATKHQPPPAWYDGEDDPFVRS